MGEELTTVAACVVLHCSEDLVGPLAASLEDQVRRPDEYVFCINGPDRGLSARLRELLDEPTILHRPDNPGFSAGVNACLEASSSRYVLLLNPDVVLDPGYIDHCLRVFREEDGVAGVAGKLLRREVGGEPDRVDTAGFVAQPWLRIVDRGAGATDGEGFQERESVLGICAAAALFDRQALLGVAEDGRVMDEDFWMYKEDQDLCIRLREMGLRLIFEPRALGRHQRGWQAEERTRVPLELRRHSLKNRYLILIKHWRWGEHGWTLPFVIAFEVFLFLALFFREPRTMKGYLLALRLVPRMMVKRRKMLKSERARTIPTGGVWPVIPVMA